MGPGGAGAPPVVRFGAPRADPGRSSGGPASLDRGGGRGRACRPGGGGADDERRGPASPSRPGQACCGPRYWSATRSACGCSRSTTRPAHCSSRARTTRGSTASTPRPRPSPRGLSSGPATSSAPPEGRSMSCSTTRSASPGSTARRSKRSPRRRSPGRPPAPCR